MVSVCWYNTAALLNKVTSAHHLPPLQFSLNFVYHKLHIIRKTGTSILVFKHTNSFLLMNLSHQSYYHCSQLTDSVSPESHLLCYRGSQFLQHLSEVTEESKPTPNSPPSLMQGVQASSKEMLRQPTN